MPNDNFSQSTFRIEEILVCLFWTDFKFWHLTKWENSYISEQVIENP